MNYWAIGYIFCVIIFFIIFAVFIYKDNKEFTLKDLSIVVTLGILLPLGILILIHDYGESIILYKKKIKNEH